MHELNSNPAAPADTGCMGGRAAAGDHDATETEWWHSFHLPAMADLFLVRADEDNLAATLDFLETQLALCSGAHVYDQCCGIGSLSVALASRGVRVTGADLCDSFIARAVREATAARADCHFHCADAFRFVPAEPCDAVFNWYSSFGYAATDARNCQMLARAFDSLKPTGRFALDVPNLPSLIRGFQRHLVRRGHSEGKHVTLIRESEMDLHDGVLRQLWTWLIEDQPPIERRSSLRLYLPHQLQEILQECGFEDIRLFGSLRGEPLTIDSPRLLCVARRP